MSVCSVCVCECVGGKKDDVLQKISKVLKIVLIRYLFGGYGFDRSKVCGCQSMMYKAYTHTPRASEPQYTPYTPLSQRIRVSFPEYDEPSVTAVTRAAPLLEEQVVESKNKASTEHNASASNSTSRRRDHHNKLLNKHVFDAIGVRLIVPDSVKEATVSVGDHAALLPVKGWHTHTHMFSRHVS